MSANPGDEIFFHHKGQPLVGKVKSTGKHGCTVEDDEGNQHRIKWELLRGHKSRVPQHYKVVHEGEDGIIVENQHGQRRLLGIGADARAEKLRV